MDLATGALGSLLPKLDELLKEEYNLPNGVRKDMDFISESMVSSEAGLRKVSRVPLDQLDPGIRAWAVEVKELSYDIDEVVDSLLMGPEGPKPANLDDLKGHKHKVANMFKKGKTKRVFADAIKDIKARVKQIAERHERYKQVGEWHTSITVDPRLLAMFNAPKDIYGIEESRQDIINKIFCQDGNFSNKQLKILSIFGCMGLGKTTLAKTVYDKLAQDFDCCAFVPVGPNPDHKKTFKDIILEIDMERYREMGTLDERQLINELHGLLEKKRYLIVVDDIWDIRTWEIIRCALMDHDCGSSVIITTRNFEVAQRAGEVYRLKPLSHEKSEELFYKRLLGGNDKIPDEMVEVTKSIITKKCGGIPLAIITVANLLVGKTTENWSLVYNSIGFGDEDDEKVKNTRNISLFSYYDIRWYLKTCLLHLSMFLEGYMIRKDTLIWKWIAEGFVREEPGVGMFEVGERYFNELINNSLVQPIEIPHSGIIIGCRVNIIVLDMICCLSKEENFVTVLDSHKQDISGRRQPRRLAIQNRVVDEGFVHENEMLANPHVRSFNATKCEFQMMPSFTSFQLLRVLALEDCSSVGDICHLEHITILVQLRYLGLLNTPICELPEGIRSLKFLQTLDLRQTKIETLPHGIFLLRQLKCLRGGSRTTTVPDGMGNLVSLEELQLSDVTGSPNIVKELGKLTELRDLKLCIRLSDERSKRDLVESLGNLQKIEILHLDGGLCIEEPYWENYVPSLHLRHVFLGMKFSRLPAWINPLLLPILSHLSVDVSVVEEEDLLILGSFPALLSLSLVGEYVCLPDIMGGGAFPRLKYCYTSGMVRFLKGAAPRLESVSFNVRLWGSKDDSLDVDFRSLLNHPQLQEVKVEVFYREAHTTEVDKVEAALRNVADVHSNRLILDISKWKSSVSEQYGSHDDVDGNEYYINDNEEDSDHEYYDEE